MNSRHHLHAALLDISKEAVRNLDVHPIAGLLVRGTIPAPLYAAYLTQVVHQVRSSGQMLQDASRRLNEQGRHRLAALFSTKSGEEHGHDRWALDDLAALGVRREAVEASPSSPAVDAYVAWARYCTEQAPAAVLGLAWVLEWFGYARAGHAADNLVAHGAIPRVESAVKFLRGHSDADRHHVEALAAALCEITDPGEAAVVVLSARVTAALYLSFFDRGAQIDAPVERRPDLPPSSVEASAARG